MSGDRAPSPEMILFIGITVMTSSFIFLGFVIFRFDQLNKYLPQRWGRPLWGYPASQFGSAYGGVLGLILGVTILDNVLEFMPFRILLGIWLAGFLAAPVVAFLDYRKYKSESGRKG